MKKLKLMLIFALAVLLCISSLFGCTPANTTVSTPTQQSSSASAVSSTSSPAPSSTGKPVVKIGVILPMTGNDAWVGEEESNAMKLMVEKCNADQNYPATLQLVIEDDRSDVTEATTCATKLAEQEKVNAVLGPWKSALCAATTTYLEPKKIPTISVGASVTNLTQRGLKYYFRVTGTNDMQVQHNMLWASKNKGWKNIVVISNNTDFGSSLAKLSSQFGDKLGMTTVKTFSYEAGAKDFYSVLTNIKGLTYDGIFLCGDNAEAANFVQQSKEQEIDISKIFYHGGDLRKVLELDKEVANGLMTNVNFDNVAPVDDQGKAFLELYKKTYNRNPSMYSAQGWVCSDVLTRAIGKCTAFDGESIMKSLESNTYDTMYGTVKFDTTHENYVTYIIQQAVNGEVKTIDANRMEYNNY